MAIRKTLTYIALGALALTGCSRNHSQYEYNGKLGGEEQVEFREKSWLFGIMPDDNILTVTKPDGRKIEYLDRFKEDLQIEKVKITANGQETTYFPDDEVGKPIVDKAQEQFNAYLQAIKEARTNEGLNNLE